MLEIIILALCQHFEKISQKIRSIYSNRTVTGLGYSNRTFNYILQDSIFAHYLIRTIQYLVFLQECILKL